MPCIFGFKFHGTLCPCQLLNAKYSDNDSLICPRCENRLRLDYDCFANELKEEWPEFEDFLGEVTLDRLMHLRFEHIDRCNFDYTEEQYNEMVRKMNQMIENFRTSQDQRCGAQIQTGDLATV